VKQDFVDSHDKVVIAGLAALAMVAGLMIVFGLALANRLVETVISFF